MRPKGSSLRDAAENIVPTGKFAIYRNSLKTVGLEIFGLASNTVEVDLMKEFLVWHNIESFLEI